MTKTSKHIPILDTIRGFAAFWVLISHSFSPALISKKIPLLMDGRVGVDIFMFLSGFLMFHLYSHLRTKKEIYAFWAARWFRISPVYYFLLICFALLLPNSGIAETRWFLAHLTYIFGFFPNPASSGMPDWSIALEIQFYLAFPFIVWLFRRSSSWFPIVIISSIVTIIFFMLWSVYSINPPHMLGNFTHTTLLPFKLPMFLLGIFFADKNFFQNIPKATILLTLNLSGIIVPACMITGFKSAVAIYLFSICVILIWRSGDKILGTKIFNQLHSLLTARWLRWTGDVSYTVYLIHSMVFYFVSTFMISQGLWIDRSPVFRILSLLIISIPLIYFLSWLSFKYLEVPMIKFGKKIISRKLS